MFEVLSGGFASVEPQMLVSFSVAAVSVSLDPWLRVVGKTWRSPVFEVPGPVDINGI